MRAAALAEKLLAKAKPRCTAFGTATEVSKCRHSKYYFDTHSRV